MYNSDTDLLFPLRVIPALRTARGAEWQQFVDDLSAETVSTADQAAFVYMMVRLGGCVGCNADSFRAMRGCTQCARQTIKRYRGSDQDLIEAFHQAQREVETYLKKSIKGTI